MRIDSNPKKSAAIPSGPVITPQPHTLAPGDRYLHLDGEEFLLSLQYLQFLQY